MNKFAIDIEVNKIKIGDMFSTPVYSIGDGPWIEATCDCPDCIQNEEEQSLKDAYDYAMGVI